MFMHTDSSKRLAQAIATFYAYGPMDATSEHGEFILCIIIFFLFFNLFLVSSYKRE